MMTNYEIDNSRKNIKMMLKIIDEFRLKIERLEKELAHEQEIIESQRKIIENYVDYNKLKDYESRMHKMALQELKVDLNDFETTVAYMKREFPMKK